MFRIEAKSRLMRPRPLNKLLTLTDDERIEPQFPHQVRPHCALRSSLNAGPLTPIDVYVGGCKVIIQGGRIGLELAYAS